jgi:hypothetical protein
MLVRIYRSMPGHTARSSLPRQVVSKNQHDSHRRHPHRPVDMG